MRKENLAADLRMPRPILAPDATALRVCVKRPIAAQRGSATTKRSQGRKQQAQKRSPGGEVLSVDELSPADEPQHTDPPIDRTEVVWAQAAINAALLNMRHECETSNRIDIWGVFEGRVLSAILEDLPETGYEELIERFGFRSPSQAFNTLNTAKRMFKRHLLAVIAEYTRDDREVEEELRALKERLLRAD